MNERGWIEPIVERVVGQVLDSHTAQLRIEIVRRVMEEIASGGPDQPTAVKATTAQAAPSAVSAGDPAALARAVTEIQLGTSQREILRALLDTSARYAARVALFVVKGSHATGWQARGFANSDAVKDFALDESAPAVVRAIRERVMAAALVPDLDQRFLQQVGTPASGEARVLPLILKDKVAALVYADSGSTNDAAGLLDVGSLELLVLSTSAWLEVNSLRKQAHKEPSAGDSHGVAAVETQQMAGQAASAYSDPFASHPPAHPGKAMAAAASAGATSFAAPGAPEVPTMAEASNEPAIAESSATEFQSTAVEMEPPLAEPLHISHAPVGLATTDAVPDTPPVPSISPADQDIHRKAQRFARLLVDEIKLYNQAKVTEGRKSKDLYDRLKEVIEKSRGTYQKRYGSTVAASGNYFHHEIIRSLAEDDLSIMGANFRH
jgi:hypothetical protein